MKTGDFWIYLLLMAAVTYLVRAVPLLLFDKKIKNKYVRSFLHYTPYAVLGCMTFPAIFYSTGYLYSGIAATMVGLVLAMYERSMVFVAVSACVAAYLVNVCFV